MNEEFKVMKRLMFCIALVLVFFCVKPGECRAKTIDFTVGTGVLARLNEDNGLLTIYCNGNANSSGEMNNYSFQNPYGDYSKDITQVDIKYGVTSIGDCAFYSCRNLKSIKIQNSVKSIGENAFYECNKLESIEIPDSVESIKEGAFYGCKILKSIKIPEGVTSINNNVFQNCEGLTSIEIPSSVTSIGEYAFYGCKNLKKIEIPNSVISIGNYVFPKGLTSITIPSSVTNIGNNAFVNCENLEQIDVDINNEYYSSQEGVLYDKNKTTIIKCPSKTNLTNITIPKGVTSISEKAFESCGSLKSIIIPNSVTDIGEYAFWNCENLKYVVDFSEKINFLVNDVETNNNNGIFYSYEGKKWSYKKIIESNFENTNVVAFIVNTDETFIDSDENNKYFYSLYIFGNGKLNKSLIDGFNNKTEINSNVYIKDGITEIENGALEKLNTIQTVDIPSSVTSIGYYVFRGDTQLTQINVDENNNNYSSENGILYDKNKEQLICCPEGKDSVQFSTNINSIYNCAFYGCGKITKIELPKSVTSIGEQAFYGCKKLAQINIPNKVETINNYAFGECQALTNITIPESVTTIGAHAFYQCSKLTSIIIPKNVTSMGEKAVDLCDNLKDVVILSNSDKINYSYFKNKNYTLYGVKDNPGVGVIGNTEYKKIQNYSIENGVIAIVINEDGNNNLYVIGNGEVTSNLVSDYNDCKNIIIKDGITEIGSEAFEEFSKLEEIYGFKSVTSIGEKAFYNCNLLNYIVIPNTLKSIGNQAFSNCSKLSKILIPKSVMRIGDKAFDGCSLLKNVAILNEDSAKFSIGTNVFNSNDVNLTVYCNDAIQILENDYSSVCQKTGWKKNDDGSVVAGINKDGKMYVFGSGQISKNNLPNPPEGYDWKLTYDAYENTNYIVAGSVLEAVNILETEDYTLDNDGSTLTINSDIEKVLNYPWKDNNSNITKVVIGTNVNSIPDDMFDELTNLTSIEVQKGNNSYSSEDGILYNIYKDTLIRYPSNKEGEEVSINNSVTEIGNRAFFGCTKIKTLKITDKVKTLGYHAFRKCSNLKNVVLGNKLTTIGMCAFAECTSLENIIIPANVNKFVANTNGVSNTFAGCTNLKNVAILHSTDVEGAENNFSVGKGAFTNTNENITIYCIDGINALTGEGSQYLNLCKTAWTIDINVSETTASTAIAGLNRDGKLYVFGTGETMKVAENDLPRIDNFEKLCWTNGEEVKPSADGNYQLTVGETYIEVAKSSEPTTFKITYNSNTTETVTNMPTDQTKDEGQAISLSNLGPQREGYTFNGWKSQNEEDTTIYKPGDLYSKDYDTVLLAQWTPITYKVSFDGNGATSGEMGDQDFTYDVKQNLTKNTYERKYTITYVANEGNIDRENDTVTYNFNNWNKSKDGDGQNYTDEQEVEKLTNENNATVTLFAQWTGEGKVTLPTPKRDGHTFQGWKCDSNTYNAGEEITVENTMTLNAIWTDNTKEYELKEDGTLYINKNVTSAMSVDKTQVNKIIISKDVTEIPEGMFEGFTNITNITIPTNITKIGANAFKGCTSLTSVIIPASVTEIDEHAFADCENLENVAILGKGLVKEKIGNKVFGKNDNSEAYVNSNLVIYCVDGSAAAEYYTRKSIEKWVTNGTVVAGININDNKLHIFGEGEVTKELLDGLKDKVKDIENLEVVIEKGITKIGKEAFKDWTNIKNVKFSDTVTTIGYAAFNGCTGLENVIIPETVTEFKWESVTEGDKTSNYSYTFANCSGLKNIVFLNDKISLAGRIFYSEQNNKSFASDNLTIYCNKTAEEQSKKTGADKQFSNARKETEKWTANVDKTAVSGINKINGKMYVFGEGNVTVTSDNKAKITPREEKGYTFEYWQNEKDENSKIDFESENSELQTVTVWNNVSNANVYTITLQDGENSSAIYEKYQTGFYSDEQCTTSITFITKPTKSGYTFKGYFEKENGEGNELVDKNGAITDKMKNDYSENITIYAYWTERKVTSIAIATAPKTDYFVGDTIDLTGGKIKVTFDNEEEETIELTSEMLNGNTTIAEGQTTVTVTYEGKTATFDVTVTEAPVEPTAYTITYNLNGGEGNFVTQTANSGETITLHSGKPTKSKYTFVGWNTKEDGTGETTYDEEAILTLNKNLELYAKWADRKVTEIVLTKPKKLTYVEGEDLDLAGGKIKVTYDNEETENIDLTAEMISEYNKDKAGEQTITVTYEGKTATFKVTVEEKEVQPTTYSVTYNLNGGEGNFVTQTANSGETITLHAGKPTKSKYTFVGWNTKEDGTGETTYDEEAILTLNKNLELYAKWADRKVTEIVLTKPKKLTYVEGEDLDLAGGKIKVTYDNEETENIDLTAEMISEYNKDKAGEQTITVTYEGKIATFKVTVEEKEVQPTTYSVTYNLNGGEGNFVTQTANSGETITLHSGKPTKSKYTFVGWNTKEDGTGETTYDEEAILTLNKNLELYAKWADRKVTEIVLTKPKKLTYVEGEDLDLAGGKIKVTYDNEETENIDLTAEMISEYNKDKAGEQTITVTYEGKTATFKVTVEEKEVQPTTYTITYNLNDGTDEIFTQTVSEDEEVVLIQNISTRQGYEFEGWVNPKEPDKIYALGDKFGKINEDIVLEGQWKALFEIRDIDGTDNKKLILSGYIPYGNGIYPWTEVREKITEIEITKDVTKIGYAAFEGCTGLNSVIIPENVQKFENKSNVSNTFEGCTNLKNIAILYRADEKDATDNFSMGSGVFKDVPGVTVYCNNVSNIYSKFSATSTTKCRVNTDTEKYWLTNANKTAIAGLDKNGNINVFGTGETMAISEADLPKIENFEKLCLVDEKGNLTDVTSNDGKYVLTIGSKYKEVEKSSEPTEIEVESVTINKTERTLTVTETVIIEATISPEEATNKTLLWTSSDDKIATVDENGCVTAIAPGEVTITATSSNGKTATTKVKVEAITIGLEEEHPHVKAIKTLNNKNYIIVEKGTSVRDVIHDIKLNLDDCPIVIRNTASNETSDDDIVSTNYTLTLQNHEDINATILINGDMDLNGKVEFSDVLLANTARIANNSENLSDKVKVLFEAQFGKTSGLVFDDILLFNTYRLKINQK